LYEKFEILSVKQIENLVSLKLAIVFKDVNFLNPALSFLKLIHIHKRQNT